MVIVFKLRETDEMVTKEDQQLNIGVPLSVRGERSPDRADKGLGGQEEKSPSWLFLALSAAGLFMTTASLLVSGFIACCSERETL